MAPQPGFTLEVSQNKYLPADGEEMHAVLTVTAHGLGSFTPSVAEIILVDRSGSMGLPMTKIAAARRASAAAVDTLRDGALFAIVAGNDGATMVYPEHSGLVVASPETRDGAKKAVERLRDHGGTAIGTWLARARELFASHPTTIRHAILLTDGHDVHETQDKLEAELKACEGLFYCDARGIGDGWNVEQLRRIVGGLRGTADAVRQDSDLIADFEELTRTAMSKAVADLRIRIKLLPGTELLYFKQVFLTENDLTERGERTGERELEFATGAWGDETHDYHLCVRSSPRHRGEDISLARVTLEAGQVGETPLKYTGSPAPILGHWTDDRLLSSRIDDRVGHYTEHAELRTAVNAGIEAFASGDREGAERAWGRAVKLATQLGNQKNLDRLRDLVDVVDADTGEVRLRSDIDVRRIKVASISTFFPTRSPSGPSDTGAAAKRVVAGCRRCGRAVRPDAAFCPQCGASLADQ